MSVSAYGGARLVCKDRDMERYYVICGCIELGFERGSSDVLERLVLNRVTTDV